MAIIGVALARNAETARKILIRFQCETTASVGDFVHLDPFNNQKVLVSSDNTSVYQTIGIIETKPDTQLAEVLILGVIGGFTSLARAQSVFLGTSGEATTTKPTTGYLHILGIAVSDTEVLITPNRIRTKLN